MDSSLEWVGEKVQILMFVGSRCNCKVRIVHERLRLEEAAERMDEGKGGERMEGGGIPQ